MVSGRKILVVEDDTLLRSLIATKLEADGFSAVTASNAQEAIKIAKDIDPDIALLDIDLGVGPNGLDVANYLNANNPGIAIVFLTNIPEPKVISRDNKSVPKGAAYLIKDRLNDTGVLNTAIEAAIREKVPASLRNDKNSEHRLSKLSKTQMSVIQSIAMGLTNAQIAEERGTTVRSVELLIKRTLDVIGADEAKSPKNSRVTLAREYIKLAGIPYKSAE